jgi:repressor LexA
MRRDKIMSLADALQLSPAVIMGWDDTPVYNNIHPIGIIRLPILGEVACGEPIFMAEEKELYVDTTTALRADFALIAKGDSMIGARIFDGDIVFVRKQNAVENGEIAVVAINDEATLKRFYKYGNDLIVLRAENPEYKDMEFRPEGGDTIRVLGKAIAFQSDVK